MNKPEILNKEEELRVNIIRCNVGACSFHTGRCIYCSYEAEILDIIQYVNRLVALNKSLESEKQSLTNTNSEYQNQISGLRVIKVSYLTLQDRIKEAVDILETEI
jgi:hypothetical protein